MSDAEYELFSKALLFLGHTWYESHGLVAELKVERLDKPSGNEKQG